MRAVRAEQPFTVVAGVLLPDHMHFLWALPPGDADYSRRWALIKARFASGVREMGLVGRRAPAGVAPRGLWQPRFWEHRIRDQHDLRVHLDYVHYNPVKHGWCTRPTEWPHSTFHRYVAAGLYPRDWAAAPDSAATGFGESLPPARGSGAGPTSIGHAAPDPIGHAIVRR